MFKFFLLLCKADTICISLCGTSLSATEIHNLAESTALPKFEYLVPLKHRDFSYLFPQFQLSFFQCISYSLDQLLVKCAMNSSIHIPRKVFRFLFLLLVIDCNKKDNTKYSQKMEGFFRNIFSTSSNPPLLLPVLNLLLFFFISFLLSVTKHQQVHF